jgi:hypothetical protein
MLVLAWVARWLVFKPKIPIWVNFRGSCDGRCWCILWPFVRFDGHLAIFSSFLVHFMVIWYVFPVLVSFSKKSGNPGFDYVEEILHILVSMNAIKKVLADVKVDSKLF